ncbi:MAG: phosphatidylserine decarboxylase [Planctomycetaceae bacterium]|nr:phosphatidylserine decarboxylase [Planctomycetaceae bacterium]
MDRVTLAKPKGARTGVLSQCLAVFQHEDINFLVTNRIPRGLATRFMGWFSRIEQPLVRDISMALWRAFSPDLDLSDAAQQSFRSLHECFTRSLVAGSRPVNPNPHVLTSPCDAILGAFGQVRDGMALQAKGFPYPLLDLLGDRELLERHADSTYVTLRLTSTMYHRLHAPCRGKLDVVRYISGDTWNVNPIALARVERLFCKNERAVLDLQLENPEHAVTLVAVAAILVASIQIHGLQQPLSLRYRGPNHVPCAVSFEKGDELGYFQHGSTVLLFVRGPFRLADGVQSGQRIRVGEALLVPT